MLRLLASLLAILGAGDHHPARSSRSPSRCRSRCGTAALPGRAAGAVPRPRRGTPLHGLTRALAAGSRSASRTPAAGDRGHRRRPQDPRLRAPARLAATARPGPRTTAGSTGRCARWPARVAADVGVVRAQGRRGRGRMERRRRVRRRVDAQAADHGRGARADRRRAARDGVLVAVRRDHALLEQRGGRRGARAPGRERGGRAPPTWSRRCGGSGCATRTCTAAT